MKRSMTIQLLAGAAISVAGATPAFAQNAGNGGQAGAAPQAVAQDTSTVGDIVVTANRREERLQEVPIAVAAYGAQELHASGANTVQDLGNLTPGLTIANQSAGITPFIRGIGAVDNTLGQEGAVAVYVDGVYLPSAYASLFSFNNIERVEVLKGPQGTLFGRNATGGLIQVVTRDPGQKPEFEGTVSYGNFQTVKAQGYAAGPLSDTLALSVAGIISHQGEGYGRNVFLNKDVGFSGNDHAIRSKLVWKPDESTTVKLSGDYSLTTHSDQGSAKNYLPGSISSIDDTGGLPGWWDVRGGATEGVRTKQYGTDLHINHDFGGISVVSITSWRKSQVVQSFDNDATSAVVLDAYIDSQKTRTISQELQLLSDPSSRIKWIVGAFFLDDNSRFAAPNGLGLFGSAVGTAVLIQNGIRTRSLAAYGELTVPLGDKTELTGGIRYTSDKRSITGKTDVLGGSFQGAPLIVSVPTDPQTNTENKPSWRAVLNHKFTPDVMIYGSYNRGFKSGNFNAVSASDKPFKSETVDAFEVGLKSELFDRHLRFNIAAFYYKYRNLQLSVLQGFNLTTLNAANSRIYGLDLDGEIAATHDFHIRFGGSYLNTKFLGFDPDRLPQCSVRDGGMTILGKCDPTGKSLTRSPKFTATVSPSYGFDTNVGRFDISATYVYNSGFFWEPDNRLKQPSYSLLSGQVGWTDPSQHFGLKAFAKNLTNEKYALWMVAFAFGDEYAAAPPRTYGVEASFKF